MSRSFHLLSLLALCAALCACGNKGPLVVPDHKPAQPEPSTTPDAGKQP